MEYPNNLTSRFINFLLTKPTSQQILNFKATAAEGQKFSTLIRKSKYELTLEEQVDLNESFKISHCIAMAKIKAFGRLKMSDQRKDPL